MNSPGTGEFPAQRASGAETLSIWWRHQASRAACIRTTSSRVCFGPSHGRQLNNGSSPWFKVYSKRGITRVYDSRPVSLTLSILRVDYNYLSAIPILRRSLKLQGFISYHLFHNGNSYRKAAWLSWNGPLCPISGKDVNKIVYLLSFKEMQMAPGNSSFCTNKWMAFSCSTNIYDIHD